VIFTVAGKTIELYADRGPSAHGVAAPTGFGAGFYNDTDSTDTPVAAAPVYDTKTNTVTITGKVSELKAAAGADVTAKALTGFTAETWDAVAQGPLLPYDEAPAPTGTTVTAGTPCGGAPVPSPTPTPTPTPSPTPAPGPTGPPPAPGYPAAGCNTVGDATGDAHIALQDSAPAEPDLDITGLALQATDTDVKAFVRVAKLGARPQSALGHTFYVNFTVGGKAVQLITTSYDPAQLNAPEDTVADSTSAAAVRFAPRTHVSVAATYVPTGIKATYDTAHSTVVLALPRKDMTAAVPAFTDGATITALTVRSAGTYPEVGGLFADSTAPANGAAGTDKWVVGDNACFAVPTKLAYLGKTSVQVTDALAVAARLTDLDGTVLPGRTMSFMAGNVVVTAKTGADGVARAALDPNRPAGSNMVNIRFAGDATTRAAEIDAPFTITAEATRLTLSVAKSGSQRTVTATLRDDDGHAVAGRTVDFYVNGKKVASAKTSSAGVVRLTTAKPAQTVTAKFTGLAGIYAACSASTKV
jgi:hypothetical protein